MIYCLRQPLQSLGSRKRERLGESQVEETPDKQHRRCSAVWGSEHLPTPPFSLGEATHGQSWSCEDVKFLFNLYEVGHRMEGFG